MKSHKNFNLKSKHLAVAAVVLCGGLMLASSTSKFSSPAVRETVGYAVIPFQKGMNHLGKQLISLKSGFEDVQKLAKEKKELEKKIVKLEEENSLLGQEREELTRLRELYELDKSYIEYDKVGAEIISKNPGNWYDTFIINKGSDDGIAVDMNVIADGGLIGIVTEVGKSWANVRSIIADNSNVSAMVTSTSDICTVVGDLKMLEKGKISFIQLKDPQNKVQAGDKIVTSNVSNKYLSGILIGYVDEITPDTNNLTKTGYVVPIADFEHLHEVLVITTLKEQKEEPK